MSWEEINLEGSFIWLMQGAWERGKKEDILRHFGWSCGEDEWR